MEKGVIKSINISKEKGKTKESINTATINAYGIEGDAHAGLWHRQISLMSQDSIDQFIKESAKKIGPGDFAENLTVSGIDFSQIGVFDQLQIGEVVLEVTQIGKKCHGHRCAIYSEVGRCIMPEKGIFARVIKPGNIKTNDEILFHAKALRAKIIVMSDRAHSGEYQDQTGPAIQEILESFFKDTRFHFVSKVKVMADREEMLYNELLLSKEDEDGIVFVAGGSGIGPRDISPEVAASLMDKIIPGVMECIRLKYAQTIPSAVLSRSMAGVMGNSLVYLIPGSPKASKEYVTEILKSLVHALKMVRGLGH